MKRIKELRELTAAAEEKIRSTSLFREFEDIKIMKIILQNIKYNVIIDTEPNFLHLQKEGSEAVIGVFNLDNYTFTPSGMNAAFKVKKWEIIIIKK